MKKLLDRILLLLLAVCTLSAFGVLFGCGSGEEIINRPESSLSYNSFIDYSILYTDSDECPSGNFTEDKLQASRTFELNKTNYIVVFFTLKDPNANGWNVGEKFNVCLSVSPCSYISTILEEATTGTFTESVECETKSTTLTYSVPEIKGEGKSKTYRIAFAFSVEIITTAEIDLSICLESEDMEKAPVVADCITVGAEKYFNFALGEEGYTVNKASSNTTGIKNLYIPKCYKNNKIVRINEVGNSYIQKVYIPDSVTTIDDSAFYNCNGLAHVYYSGDLAGWCCISGLKNVMGGKTLYIGGNEVEGDIVIPDGITSISEYALCDCDKITSITILDGVTSIDNSAFRGCDKITNITISDSVVSIGEYAFYDCINLTSINIPDSVESIGVFAFDGCYYLTSVNITDIAAWCKISFGNTYANPLFYANNLYLNDELVKEIVIPDSVTSIGSYAFHSCSGFTSVTIGNSVKSIGKYAFYNCRILTRLTIPASMVSIGEGAFNECYKLIEIKNLSQLTITAGSSSNGYVGYYAKRIFTEGESCLSTDENGFKIYDDGTDKILVDYVGTDTELVLPGEITQIYKNAFMNCSSLTSIIIPDSVTTIDEAAFYKCSGLTSVTIGNNVTSIGDYAFSGCSSLTSITIPDGVTTIGNYVFENCSSLTSATIPDSVEIIGSCAFYSCSSLTNINIPDAVTSIKYRTFYGCSSLTSIIIHNGVTFIDAQAFSGCSGLTSVVIPDSVESMGESVFSGCSALESITIPFVGAKAGVTSSDTYQYPFGYIFGTLSYSGGEGITQYYYGSSMIKTVSTQYFIPTSLKKVTVTGGNILYGAFYGCSNLTSINMPDSLTSIGNSAFWHCYCLKSVTIPASVTTIGNFAFEGCSSLTSVKFENTSGWRLLFNSTDEYGGSIISSSDLASSSTAANYLSKTYSSRYWLRS